VEIEEEAKKGLHLNSSMVQPSSSSSNGPHHSIIASVNNLCQDLDSDTFRFIGRKNKTRGIKRSTPNIEYKFRKRLTVINFPGHQPEEVEKLSEDDKVFDGTVTLSTTMTEQDVRKEVAQSLNKKESEKYDYSKVKESEFEFVKCANRKIRRPDGELNYDGRLLKQLYGGSVYVRLNSPLPLKEASIL
jgi:hypothetical protein